MKEEDHRHNRKRSFLKLPTYPGGKQAFLEFIEKHLNYPAEALEHKVQGTVYLEYDVDDMGKVLDVRVKKRVGSGCDEEAVRLIRMLQYHPVKNRGLRLKSLIKARIQFKLPGTEIPVMSNEALNVSYSVTQNSPDAGQKPDDKKDSGYGYTISLGNS